MHVCESVEMEWKMCEKNVIIERIMEKMGNVHLNVKKWRIVKNIVEME